MSAKHDAKKWYRLDRVAGDPIKNPARRLLAVFDYRQARAQANKKAIIAALDKGDNAIHVLRMRARRGRVAARGHRHRALFAKVDREVRRA